MSITSNKKKNSLSSKIESRAEALKVIKELSIVFVVVGAFQGAAGIFLFPEMLYDAVLNIVLGLVLMILKSRIAAVLLLLLSGASVVVTVLNLLGITASGGGNVVVALLIFWAAVKAVEATFKLHGRFAHEPNEFTTNELPPSDIPNLFEPRFSTLEKVLIGLVLLLLFGLAYVVVVMVG